MKIVIFASLTEDTTANYLIRAFQKYCSSVFVFSDLVSPLANRVIDSCIDIYEECKKFNINPDLFLFIEGGSMRYFPKGIEKLSCKTAWYGIDTHMDYKKHLAIGNIFDVSFIAQKEFVAQLLKDGIKNVHWLPLAFEPNLNTFSSSSKEYLISYVGSNNISMHPIRYQLIDSIKSNFENCYFGRAIPNEMSNIYAKSFMVFNKSVNNDINMRYFEAMGEGAVLLTDKSINNGVEELFKKDIHFFEYNNAIDLIELINSLKNNQEKLLEVGKVAKKNILKFHTYQNRVESIIQISGNSTKFHKDSYLYYIDIFYHLNIYDECVSYILILFKKYNTKSRFNKILIKIIRLNLINLLNVIKVINLSKKLIVKLLN